MLSRLVCRRNRGANGSKNAASSGSASGEALGTLLIFILHSTTETNKVVLEIPIVGVITDGQHSIRKAVARALPGVPHQLCHFHYLREAAKLTLPHSNGLVEGKV